MDQWTWLTIYNPKTGEYEIKKIAVKPLPAIKDFTEEEMQAMGFLKLGDATEDGVL